MWITAQSLQMFVLCYTYSLQYGHGHVRWTLAEKPVVFGNNITLHCEIPKYITSCNNSTQWTGGEDNGVIAINGKSSNEAKYEMIQYNTSFNLIIKDFQETDINQRYTCACGTLTYGKNLTAKEIPFLHIPTNNSIVDSSLIENSMLSVNITLKDVYPAPICYMLFSGGRNNIQSDTKNITVATVRISTEYYMFEAYLTLIFKIPTCNGNIKIYCSIWQKSLVIYNRYFDNCPASVKTWNTQVYILCFVGAVILLPILTAGVYYVIINLNEMKKRLYNYMRVMSN